MPRLWHSGAHRAPQFRSFLFVLLALQSNGTPVVRLHSSHRPPRAQKRTFHYPRRLEKLLVVVVACPLWHCGSRRAPLFRQFLFVLLALQSNDIPVELLRLTHRPPGPENILVSTRAALKSFSSSWAYALSLVQQSLPCTTVQIVSL